LPREISLFQPRHDAALADAAAGIGLTHPLPQSAVSRVFSIAFCAATTCNLQLFLIHCEDIYKTCE
jgi:hypothetical protein